MITIEQQREVANDLLSKLEVIDPYCIIAGGAPRNWYLNKLANDIDVFIHVPQYRSDAQRLYAFKQLGLPDMSSRFINRHTNRDNVYHVMSELRQIYECLYNKCKVQIMCMASPTFTSVVPHFPLSISKVWYKNNHICLTKEAIESFKNKTIFKTNFDYSDDHYYITKIREQFPDYCYVSF